MTGDAMLWGEIRPGDTFVIPPRGEGGRSYVGRMYTVVEVATRDTGVRTVSAAVLFAGETTPEEWVGEWNETYYGDTLVTRAP